MAKRKAISSHFTSQPYIAEMTKACDCKLASRLAD